MNALKFGETQSAPPTRTINLDPIPFSQGVRAATVTTGTTTGTRASTAPTRSSSASDRWTPSTTVRHSAEDAIERTQRRLDNLRNALGPDYARGDDGPWAA